MENPKPDPNLPGAGSNYVATNPTVHPGPLSETLGARTSATPPEPAREPANLEKLPTVSDARSDWEHKFGAQWRDRK